MEERGSRSDLLFSLSAHLLSNGTFSLRPNARRNVRSLLHETQILMVFFIAFHQNDKNSCDIQRWGLVARSGIVIGRSNAWNWVSTLSHRKYAINNVATFVSTKWYYLWSFGLSESFLTISYEILIESRDWHHLSCQINYKRHTRSTTILAQSLQRFLINHIITRWLYSFNCFFFHFR